MLFWSMLEAMTFTKFWACETIVFMVIAPTGIFMLTTSGGSGDTILIFGLKGMLLH